MRTYITEIRLSQAKRAAAEAELAATRARFDALCAGIGDPKSDPAELSRLIASEIAGVTKNLLSRRFTAEDAYLLRGFAEQVKALRELGKQLVDTEVWSRKEILNFDGEKFQFVLQEIVALFVAAMKEAGVLEDLRVSIMKHYKDLMAMNEPRVRRETEKLGNKKRA